MEASNQFCAELIKKFDSFTKKPENYLGLQNNVAEEIKVFVKSLYDFTKTVENESRGDALPELIIQDFDEEQIWQELELQNDSHTNSLTTDVALLLARKERLGFPVENTLNDESDKSDSKIDTEEEEEQDDLLSDDNELEEENRNIERKRDKQQTGVRKKSRSVVDDRFFKLQDLERFLTNEDRKFNQGSKKDQESDDDDEEDSDDESVDLFEEIPSDGETEKECYADFFDEPDGDNEMREEENDSCEEQDEEEEDFHDDDGDKDDDDGDKETDDKRVRFNLLDDGEDDVKSKDVKSSYENRQERLKSRISKLESEALGEKPWQLKGEVAGTSRPQNSLLEEVVEFDLTSRPAPIITEQTTLKLEDLITQRIRDKAWDDVERKVKPVETPQEYKKKLVLNMEKSKQSLAQVYEDEYLKQRDNVAPDKEDEEEEEPEAHREIRVMLGSLFAKLDALSNFHYTPKPAAPEVKVISNVAAITMEEVAPVATTNATLLAPEEVKAKAKGDVMSKQERTSTDRKRERRHKKMMQRDRQHDKEKRDKLIDKLAPGLGNKYSKEKTAKLLEGVVKERNVSKMDETTKSVRSSTAFFSQLQEEVTSQIRSKTTQRGSKKRKIEKMSAKSFKL